MSVQLGERNRTALNKHLSHVLLRAHLQFLFPSFLGFVFFYHWIKLRLCVCVCVYTSYVYVVCVVLKRDQRPSHGGRSWRLSGQHRRTQCASWGELRVRVAIRIEGVYCFCFSSFPGSRPQNDSKSFSLSLYCISRICAFGSLRARVASFGTDVVESDGRILFGVFGRTGYRQDEGDHPSCPSAQQQSPPPPTTAATTAAVAHFISSGSLFVWPHDDQSRSVTQRQTYSRSWQSISSTFAVAVSRLPAQPAPTATPSTQF